MSASISLLCGETSKATIGTLRQANKTLKFAKENSDVSLTFPKLCKPEDAVMIAMFDASWGVRSSQGSSKPRRVSTVALSYQSSPWRRK
jgi:hypothetical protein